MSHTAAAMSVMAPGGAMTGASVQMSPSDKYTSVFNQIDTSGSGSITKSQFEQTFSSLKMPPSFRSLGADTIFAQLDPTASGSVSKSDFVSGMTSQMQAMRAARSSTSAQPTSAEFLAQLQNLTTPSSTGSDAVSSTTARGVGTSLDKTV